MNKLNKVIKNIKTSLIFAFLLILFINSNVYADTASDITSKCKITTSKLNINRALDKRYSTGIKFQNDTSINIQSPEKIGALYILWDKLPESWHLENRENKENKENSNQTISKNFQKDVDFYLHQLIKIEDDNINELSLNMVGNDYQIAEIYVYGKGCMPKSVQNWKMPHIKADLLLFSTHADDEHLFFGGTMPYYSGELNLKVQLAYLTNHYNYRVHELLNGLWEVGIHAYPIISDYYDYYADSLEYAKQLYDENEIIEYQTKLIRKFKPEVIIGHDLKGEYGHGVHMLNAYSITKAIEISQNPEIFPDSAQKYGVWDVPKCYLHLYKQNKLSMNWDVPLKYFDGNTAFQMAEKGYAKHISQQEFFSVGRRGVFDCSAFGLYRSTIGEDKLKNDFLENININRRHNTNKNIYINFE